MTVSSYLDYVASCAQLSQEEENSIRTSISTLCQRLIRHFGNELEQQDIFGSYRRGTILPRKMDKNSDIDYMVVFRDGSFRPQTYLDKLRRFVEASYPRSAIKQSSPTIQLLFNHICFEIVPATRSHFYGLYIPNKQFGTDSWMQTDPHDISQKLIQKNQTHGNCITPLIQVVKYWNAINGGVFDSFELETRILDFPFHRRSIWGHPDLETYFFEFMLSLQAPYLSAQWKQQKIQSLRFKMSEVESHKSYNQRAAEVKLMEILPNPAAQGSALSMLYRS